MTEERQRLIDAMERVINVNPRKEIFAALLANVAESYHAEQIKKLNIADVSKCACENVDDITPYYDINSDIFRCDKCDKHFC